MQVIQEFQLENHRIPVYNEISNPLFDAKQVIETVLEYKQLEDSWFYKTNKENGLFIVKQMSGVSPVMSLSTKYHKNSADIYLTEFGLYECLFTSNKPLAQQFRLQVMTLLRDLRIGNLNLIVQKECETTRIIEEYKDSVLSYVTKNNDITTQLEILRSRIEQCAFLVYIYEYEIVSTGELYRGSTIAPKIRTNTHKYKSSCIKLKEAHERGEQINVYIIGEAKVYNDNERDYFEQQFILVMPSDKKLNLKTPQPNSFDNISQEHIQYTKMAVETSTRTPLAEFLQQLEQSIPEQLNVMSNQQIGVSIQYSTVNLDQHINYINDITLDCDFKQKIHAVKQFIITNGFTPRDSDLVEASERSMGKFLVKLRNAYRTNSTANYNLSAERYSYIRQEIPTLLQSDNQPFFDKTMELKAFIQQNNRNPKQRGQNNNNQVESELYDWLSHRRSDYKKGKLPQECFDFITNQMPDFEFITLTDDQKFTKKVQQLKEFYDQHHRFPLQKDDKVLQTYIKTLKSANNNQATQSFKLTPERKQYIMQILPNFIW